MTNRERSELIMAKVVSKLAENGVLTSELGAAEVFGEYPEAEGIQLFDDLISWLEAEGVVRLTDQAIFGLQTGAVYSLVLTSYGFSQLERGFKGGLTFGEAAQEISRTGGFMTATGDFIGGMLGGLTKSVSG